MRQRACVYDEGEKLVLDTKVPELGMWAPVSVTRTVPVARILAMDLGVKVWMEGGNDQWTLYPWHSVLWVDALP